MGKKPKEAENCRRYSAIQSVVVATELWRNQKLKDTCLWLMIFVRDVDFRLFGESLSSDVSYWEMYFLR